MGITTLLFHSIGFIFLFTFILALRKQESGVIRTSPRTTSYFSLGLILFNWVLYLAGFYVWLPPQIADFLFTAVWIVVLLAGGFFAIKEFRNHAVFAIILGAITFYSAAFVFLLHLISQM